MQMSASTLPVSGDPGGSGDPGAPLGHAPRIRGVTARALSGCTLMLTTLVVHLTTVYKYPDLLTYLCLK